MSAPVIYAIPRAELGGAQRSLVLLLRALDRAAFPPFVLLGEDGPLACALGELAVPHEVAGASFRSARGVARFVRAARRHGARLLHLYAARTLALAARALGLAVVERVNLLRSEHAGGLVRRAWLDRALLGLADRIVVPSRAMERQLLERGVPAERLRLVPNGVWLPSPRGERAGLRAGLGVPGDAFLVLCVGRLERIKGPDVLVRAFARAHFEGEARLALVGAGSERAALEALARGLGLGERARFLGDREDVADLLAASDVLVQPSRSEVLSNAVLEAQLAGVCVVATDVGGTREAVRDGETGVLVPGEDPDALARALEALARDSVRRAALAERGRALTLRERSLEAMARATEAVYREALAARGIAP